MNGLGAVLTRLSIAESLLKQGFVQKVTPIIAPYESAYYLLWPNRSHKVEKLLVFAQWLKEQCHLFERSMATLSLAPDAAKPFGFLKADELSLPLKHPNS